MKKIGIFSAALSMGAFLLAPAVFAEDETQLMQDRELSSPQQEAEESTVPPSATTNQPSTQQDERAAMSEKEPHILKASEVIGYTVKDREGQELGEIEELVIDPQSGRIVYAALATGGFLGMGDKLFAVPWESMRFMPEEQSFTLNIARETLERSPGFDKDNWPVTAK